MNKTEQARLRKQKQRDKEKAQSVTQVVENVTQSPESVTQVVENVTQDVTLIVPAIGILPERPRFLTLSDGQVMDRCRLPTKSLPKTKFNDRVIDPVRAERYRLWREGIVSANPVLEALAYPAERAKLRRVCTELSNHHQLHSVSYGVTPMDLVSEYLDAF